MSGRFPSTTGMQAEIDRLNKIIKALMDRAERSASIDGSDFNLFHMTVTLEDQVRQRTRELQAALLENEKITRALRESERHILQLAFYDALTGLPNRRLLNERMAQAIVIGKRSGRHGALMFLDLDNFKSLNDSHGHEVGDLLLIEVARRITACVRATDTVARFGGDEFVILLGELDADRQLSIAQAGQVAEKIRNALAEPYLLQYERADGSVSMVEHRCTSSIGVALFQGRSAVAEELLKQADAAMYRSKEGGRNRVSFSG
jgi:diguanylate cyclase (GGDEF)-like protein